LVEAMSATEHQPYPLSINQAERCVLNLLRRARSAEEAVEKKAARNTQGGGSRKAA
jgi:hypothetical protein